jgi:hypothetical protein
VTHDPLTILESSYDLAGDEPAWLARILEMASPSLDRGKGVMAFLYDATKPAWVDVHGFSAVGEGGALLPAIFQPPPPADAGSTELVRVFRTGKISTMLEVLAQVPVGQDYYRELLRANGLKDMLVVNATDPSHRGCALLVPCADVDTWAPRAKHQWGRIATHISAGLRVRRQLGALAANAEPSGGEAVLCPDGKLEHAGEAAKGNAARAALRDAVLAMDRARGPLRRTDPDEALAVWRGLVAGRWSLLDRFDSDGRRFIVAHRNDPEAPDLRGLTLRERLVYGYAALGHSNKVIAYELGLSTSTVAKHLGRARTKLGAHEAS